MTRTAAGLCVPVVLLVLLPSCASWDTGTVAHESAASALSCRVDDTEMEQLGAYRYRGRGCGADVIVACSASTLEPVCLRESEVITAGDVQVAEHTEPVEPAPDEDAPPPFDDEPNPEVETRIRAGLAARRDDILACTGQPRIGVRAAYAPDGSVAFSLQGALADTPEQGCVENALDGVRVAATGHAGVVIHLVQ
ncbi:MAG: hypothetical protein AB8I08_28110 [Sandaracinaceae bacterium]